MSTFDVAVSHLSLTRAERESHEEGATTGERERQREAMRGAGGSEGGREGGVCVSWGGGGGVGV